MLNGLLKKFGLPFSHRDRHELEDEFLRKLSNKNKEVKKNDLFFSPNCLTFGMKYDN